MFRWTNSIGNRSRIDSVVVAVGQGTRSIGGGWLFRTLGLGWRGLTAGVPRGSAKMGLGGPFARHTIQFDGRPTGYKPHRRCAFGLKLLSENSGLPLITVHHG